MTFRSVIMGLAGAVFVCAVTYFNDRILRQTHFVGNNMPVSVYGLLLLFALVVNTRLRKWALTGRELAVILTLVLAACCIPGSGLMRTFTVSLIKPYHFNRIQPGWKEQAVLESVPPQMLADVSKNENVVLDGFIQGLGDGHSHIALHDVPWAAWTQCLAFWTPIILTLWLAMVALSLVLHRQWSEHEHLPYPIATFTNAFLPVEGQRKGAVFGNRLFWLGLGGVAFVHLNNYACEWFPEVLIRIPTRFDFQPLAAFVPVLVRGGGGWMLNSSLYFTVIGIAFFIPGDLSAAFGFGPFLWAITAGILAGYGVNVNSVVEGNAWWIGLKPSSFALFGASLGVFLSLLYTGRHYYAGVLQEALGSRRGQAGSVAVWGCRAFLLLMCVFVLQLSLGGLDWRLAVVYAAILVVFYVVMSRVIAETGLFHIQFSYFPCMIIWGLFGARAIGPGMLLILQLVTTVLIIDPRESLMPFVVNSLKLLELRRVPLGRVAAASSVALVLGLAVALPVTLYLQYDQAGTVRADTWSYEVVPKMPFDNAVAVQQKLASQGTLEAAKGPVTWARLAAPSPNPLCLWMMLGGLGLVLICAAGRLRFPWWPIHPLLFVLWATNHVKHFAGAFILGWAIKLAVVKYGGSSLYNRLKPLMIGLIAGEVIGAVIPSIVGAIYYLATGEPPKAFHVLPQ